jgi:chromosome partitioning protein
MSVSLQLVGVHEVAEMLGITKGAVGARRRRRSFPPPLAELRCGPIWGRWQIEEYLVKRDASRERHWHIDKVDELMGR